MQVARISQPPPEFLNRSSPPTGLIAEWHALAAGNPLADSDWLLSWWEHFGPAGRHGNPHYELCLLAVRDEQGRLVGLAPWYLERSLRRGNVIRYLGSGSVCTDYLAVLSLPGMERAVAEAVAEWLLGQRRECWQRLELIGTDDRDPTVPLLMDALAERDCPIHVSPGHRTWRLELPGSWEQYLAGVSANRRSKIRQMLKRAFDSEGMTLHRAVSADEFDSCRPCFQRLHQARRESVGEEGIFRHPAFADFLHDVGQKLLAQNRLELLLLEHRGRAIAAEFNLLGGGIVWKYQSGMDPAAEAHRPGLVLVAEGIRHAIGQGCQAIDMLRGDESYKAQWGAVARQSLEYRAVRRLPAARVRHGLWLAGRQARRWAKRGLAAVRGKSIGRAAADPLSMKKRARP